MTVLFWQYVFQSFDFSLSRLRYNWWLYFTSIPYHIVGVHLLRAFQTREEVRSNCTVAICHALNNTLTAREIIKAYSFQPTHHWASKISHAKTYSSTDCTIMICSGCYCSLYTRFSSFLFHPSSHGQCFELLCYGGVHLSLNGCVAIVKVSGTRLELTCSRDMHPKSVIIHT